MKNLFFLRLTKQISKKFFKKNILLHQNLEKFLRGGKETNISISDPSLNSKNFKNRRFKKFLKTKNNNFNFNKHFKISINNSQSLNLYKPISWLNVQQIINSTFFQPTFFPYKKPFMQFWIFPLLGACFLSLLTSTNSEKVTKTNKLTDFQIIHQKIENSSQNVLLSSLNLQETRENRNHSEILAFSNFLANYYGKQSLKTQKNLTQHSLNQELEDLYRFYLNLTTKNLQTANSNDNLKNFSNFQNSELFFEKNLLQPLYIKKSNFQWNWHSLQQMTSIFSPTQNVGFYYIPQKLNHLNFQKTQTNKLQTYDKNFVNLTLKSPTLSYEQAAVLFQNWLTSLELDLALHNAGKNSQTCNFENVQILVKNGVYNFSKDFVTTLQKLYKLEKLDFQSVKNNKKIILEFQNFLKFLENNEKQLKKSFLMVKENNAEIVQPFNNFLTAKVPNVVGAANKNNLSLFFPKIQDSVNQNFKKILLENYLQKQTNKSLFQKIFHKKEFSMNLNLTKENFFSVKNFENNFKRQKKLKFYKILQSTILLNSKKLSKTNLQNFKKNLATLNVDRKLIKITNELILLENWKNSLKQSMVLRENSEKTEISKTKFSENLTNIQQQTLIQEIYLYRQFDKICQKLFGLVLSKNQIQKDSQFPHFGEKRILKYTKPILFSSLDLKELTTLKNLELSSQNLKQFFPENRTKITWIETGWKKNSSQSVFTFIEPSVFKSLTQKPQDIELLKTKETFFKNFLSTQKLNLNFLPHLNFEKLNRFAAMDEQFQIENLNKFAIIKNYETLKNQQVYSFSFKSQNTLNKRKVSLKSLKFKKSPFFSPLISKVANRKAEKIFRTYGSIKSPKDKKTNKNNVLNSSQNSQEFKAVVLSNTKNSTFQKMRPIFEKLKNKVKTRKFVLKTLQKEPFYLEFSKVAQTNNIEFSKFSKMLLTKRDNLSVANFSKTNSNLKKLYFKMRKNKIVLNYPVSHSFLNNLANLNFLKKSDFLRNDMDLMRFEKKKSLEKKRRLKKLKLENRRRKKRKRFYPRPIYLRFQLYSQFLQKRHSNKFELSSKKDRMNLKTQRKENKFQKISNSKPFRFFKQKIYRQRKEKWGLSSPNTFLAEKAILKQFSTIVLKPTFHQKEFYKISNETLTEFERLCWKSYWLRSNLKPYIRRIQQNLKNMQKFETLKNSEKVLEGLLQNFTKQIHPSFLVSKTSFNSNGVQSFKNIVPFYLNIHESLKNSSIENATNSIFKNFENNAEYERLLYERITEEIKNVKSQLNVDGQIQARSYKVGRQKIQKPMPKMFLESLHAIQNNYFEPNVKGIFEGFIPNSSAIKPLGDLATLRVLWACHKTNLFTYKENNLSKQIWTLYKQREQTKNNKTKKFVSKFFKFSPFKSKNLKSLSESKTKRVSKKLQLFGQFIYGKNYQTYLRNFKFKLQQMPTLKTNLQPQNSLNTSNQIHSLGETKQWFETTTLENKLQKRSIHFWWSSQKASLSENKIPFFMFSPLIFSDFSNYISENSNKLIANKNLFCFSQKDSLELFLNNSLVTTTFWIACCLFHLAIFFTIIRIPEIRSLLKFQFLVLSKLTNAYLIGLFSIYDLLKTYKTKLQFLMHKTFLISTAPNLNFTKKNLNRSFNQSHTFQQNLILNANFVNSMDRQKLTLKESVQKLKISNSNPIQSTLNYEFYYRELFTLFENNSIEKQNNFDFKLSNKMNSILKSSIHSVFNQSEKPTKKVQPNLISSQILFDSWHTGFLWSRFGKLLNKQKLLKSKKIYLTQFQENSLLSGKPSVKNEKSNFQLQYVLSLFFLSITKFSIQIFYTSLTFLYKIILTGIDLMESILLLFYKFLEKPAELMVAWIAEIFLIEWSSDVTTYIPEAFDHDIWISVKKFSRSTRFIGNLPFSFFIQRLILSSTEIFYSWLVKPDADLLTRQKKGVIFWDIWAEILIQAAETYKMNLSSLNSVKEEQELLIENLLEEKPILKIEKSKSTQNNLKEFPSKTQKLELEGNNANNGVFLKNNQRKGNKDSISFLNSKVFKESLKKMQPLTKFLQEFPTNPSDMSKQSKNSLGFAKTLLPSTKVTQENLFFFTNPIKMESSFSMDLFKSNQYIEPWKRWAVNQYLTTQGRDTDLFMDIHPPKSFSHIRFLKTYLPAQEILSSIVCDIYAGLFPHRVSKNILIVGAPGSTKGFFIQALAGETELKIVTDNAHRYAFVNGGVPIGMKLLRDVFDSLALHTPCLFLLEDIHIIGERRPMLISDDELSKTKDFTFGAEQEEVHEKNRLLYQFSRHALSHYKKPYKGDFSASIPTNHFSYDLFLGVQPPRKRSSDLTPKSPLAMARIEKVLTSQEGSDANNIQNKNRPQNENLLSLLQLSMEQIFAPPATSPFNILLMKEQKKLKPKKVVKEMPWSGLSYDQFMLISKSQYSVRVKVALLAETAMTNLSIKLDMITDLLVIIDSVRSNRGFVVFATTHLPALLDPALRRPGRFDETLSLPLLPNLMTRFEIFKTTLTSYTTTDFFDLSLFTSKQKQNENEISSTISKALLLLLNTKNSKQSNFQANFLNFPVFSNFFNDYSIYSLPQAFQTTISQNSLLLNTTKFKRILFQNGFKRSLNSIAMKTLKNQSLSNLLTLNSSKLVFAGNDKLNYISLSYGQAGQFLIESLILHDFKTYSTKFLMSNNPIEEFDNYEQSVFQTLYGSSLETKNTLLKLFAGKISEFFVLSNSNNYTIENTDSKSLQQQKQQINTEEKEKEPMNRFLSNSKPLSKNQEKRSLMQKNRWFSDQNLLQTNPSQSALFENVENFQGYWQSAISFLDGLSQKRYLYNKNSIVSKMLFFEDNMSLREPPSPPNSSILMPGKKFENYKRTLKDFIQKPMLTIHEKLQIHQKQRFLKLLYNIPVQKSFPTFSNQTNSTKVNQSLLLTNFYTSFKELGYLDLRTLKPTSSYLIYKNRFLTRQRFSFLNQWWNGQLAEHNVETTYLSHVDWRSMFVQSLGDLVIDFPDADQYYNPKQRRWYLHSNSWAYWLDFEKNHRTEISQHSILQCFTKTSHLLNENRELFDYLAFRFLRYHQLKEFDLLQTLIRFHKIEQC